VVPWIVSNPIYALEDHADEAPLLRAAARVVPLPGQNGWAVEKSSTSTAGMVANPGTARLSYTLGPGVAFDQFAALVSSVDESLRREGFDRLQFTVRADRPVRFSAQLRQPGSEDRRWRYSVYADETPRLVVAPIEDFRPVNRQTPPHPTVANIGSILFVVDTLNAVPSATGSIWLSDVTVGVGSAAR